MGLKINQGRELDWTSKCLQKNPRNLKNAELVNRSFSAPACEGAHRLAGNGELSATINRQNPIMGKSHKNVLPYGCVKTPHEAYIQI